MLVVAALAGARPTNWYPVVPARGLAPYLPNFEDDWYFHWFRTEVLFGYAGTGFDSCTITAQRGFVFVVCVLMIAVI